MSVWNVARSLWLLPGTTLRSRSDFCVISSASCLLLYRLFNCSFIDVHWSNVTQFLLLLFLMRNSRCRVACIMALLALIRKGSFISFKIWVFLIGQPEHLLRGAYTAVLYYSYHGHKAGHHECYSNKVLHIYLVLGLDWEPLRLLSCDNFSICFFKICTSLRKLNSNSKIDGPRFFSCCALSM